MPSAARARKPRAVDLPIDGDRSPLVRPYYRVYEQQPQPVEVVW
ncbi:hypothetical protein [Streptomyces sp. NBRC 110611]|nr:hypothetical protein [Streptomyces sp. NBRC 110611]